MDAAGKGQMRSSLNPKASGQKHRSLFKKTPKGKFTACLAPCLMYANYDLTYISDNILSDFFY